MERRDQMSMTVRTKLMPVIYIAGPFRGPNAWEIEQNIRRAEEQALEVWRMGAAAMCPHTNNRFFQGAAADDVWLRGDIELMHRCDAVWMVPGFSCSKGALAERKEAIDAFIPVFEDIDDVRRFIDGFV